MRMLFVDDEEAMHGVMRTILLENDNQAPVDLFAEPAAEASATPPRYSIDFFSDAERAFTSIREQAATQDPYALLITDLRMPGRSGAWLAKEARQIDPRIRLIFFTAYADFGVDDLAVEVGARNFLYLEKTTPPVIIRQSVDSELASWLEIQVSRRAARRVTLADSVEFLSLENLPGRVIDISITGVGVETESHIDPKTIVRMRFAGVQAEAIGEIMWNQRIGSKYRLGIRFQETDGILEAAIKALV